MAQHILIQKFKQVRVKVAAENIRKKQYFNSSLNFEPLPDKYNETKDDKVYITYRRVPKSIAWFKVPLEVHTKPVRTNPFQRRVTNIYLVI